MSNTNQSKELDANDLERMAKARPDDCFLKGSGVLKLLDAIRKLEQQHRQQQEAYLNMRAWAEANGLDTTAYAPLRCDQTAKPTDHTLDAALRLSRQGRGS